MGTDGGGAALTAVPADGFGCSSSFTIDCLFFSLCSSSSSSAISTSRRLRRELVELEVEPDAA
jgi:hypothetical protein